MTGEWTIRKSPLRVDRGKPHQVISAAAKASRTEIENVHKVGRIQTSRSSTVDEALVVFCETVL